MLAGVQYCSVFGLGIAFGSAAVIADDFSALETRVQAIFADNCASCHDDEDSEPVLSDEIDLRVLRSDADYIIAGNAKDSKFYQLITLPDGDKDRMPKSTAKKPKVSLTEAQKADIRDWIDGVGMPKIDREYISYQSILKIVDGDVTKLEATGEFAKSIRYLTLANFYNQKDASGHYSVPENRIRDFHFSVSKLLNSLSWKEDIVQPVVVDGTGVLLRFNLDDYEIDLRLWERLFGGYPYHVITEDPEQEVLRNKFGSVPIMRADFFVFAMSQPPFYYEALRLPGGQNLPNADIELEQRMGITYENAIVDPRAVRAGFQRSNVSQGNRVIERLPLPGKGGYFWKSYDFDPNRVNEIGGDLFRAPLGPIRSPLSNDPNLKFSHDGGEIIFSLPNGLQAYFLTNRDGARIDEGPIEVVTDISRSDGKIINGISCMACHNEGMLSAGVRDEVKGLASNLTLSAEGRKALEKIYDDTRLTEFFQADADRFKAALLQCGTYSGGAEPVRMLCDEFKKNLFPWDLSPEFGLNLPDVSALLARSQDPKVQIVASKFQSSTPVPRLDFQNAFPAMVEALEMGKAQKTDQLGLIEFGGYLDPTDLVTKGEGNGVVLRDRTSSITVVRPPTYKGTGGTSSGGFPKPMTGEGTNSNGVGASVVSDGIVRPPAYSGGKRKSVHPFVPSADGVVRLPPYQQGESKTPQPVPAAPKATGKTPGDGGAGLDTNAGSDGIVRPPAYSGGKRKSVHPFVPSADGVVRLPPFKQGTSKAPN